MFGVWIKVPSNAHAFEQHLLSYLTLTFEQHSRITHDMITDRINMLQFLSKLLCIPLRASVVRLLADVVGDGGGLAGVKPEALCSVQTGEDNRLGIWVAMPGLAVDHTHRPQFEGHQSSLKNRLRLPCSREEDLRILHECFSDRQLGSPAALVKSESPQELSMQTS